MKAINLLSVNLGQYFYWYYSIPWRNQHRRGMQSAESTASTKQSEFPTEPIAINWQLSAEDGWNRVIKICAAETGFCQLKLCFWFFTHFYARHQNASRVLAVVYAFVRLSVTLLICIKTVQARVTKSSLLAATRNLVNVTKLRAPG